MVRHAREVTRRVKQAQWLEWCCSCNQHTRPADLWAKLWTASGARPQRPSAHPHPLQEAERLVDMFSLERGQRPTPRPGAEGAGSAQAGARGGHPCGTAQSGRYRTTIHPSGAGTVQTRTGHSRWCRRSHLLHAGPRRGRREAAVLAVINCSWLAGCLPSAWKEADIHPIPKARDPTWLRPYPC